MKPAWVAGCWFPHGKRRAIVCVFHVSLTWIGLARAQTPVAAFALDGLSSPATVAETIFVSAPTVPPGARVTYILDNQPGPILTQPPFWMGGQTLGAPFGYSVTSLAPGQHVLRATAALSNGVVLSSDRITLLVIPSANAQFSGALKPYANQPSAQQESTATMLQLTANTQAALTPLELATRLRVLAMYKNWGIDPSLDATHDQSALLPGLNPASWAAAPTSGARLSLLFSPDAPFYQAIPRVWPRVALPAGYIQKLQLNTNRGGDGIGFGEVTAQAADPELPVKSEWPGQPSTLKTFSFPMPANWYQQLPAQPAGDLHMIFVDAAHTAFVSSYKTTLDRSTGGPDALYAASPAALNSLGDHGGSIAAGFAELPAMLQPGEATDPGQPIRHALGGPVGRVWAARVYPAGARDDGVRTAVNTCTGQGMMNTGLVPYGGVIQLDPDLDLATLKLTLPARRILEAIQTYGYYVMDFGCADLDIYTAISESELDPFGGLWGYNKKGVGVQNELQQVLTRNTLYVVAPLIKKQ